MNSEQGTLFTIPAEAGFQIEIRARFAKARASRGELWAAQCYPEHPDAPAILAKYENDPAPLFDLGPTV